MVFAGLDVLIIVVSLAVFFVGTIVVCGCLVLGWRCFGFGFGLCALVLGCFDVALICCFFGCKGVVELLFSEVSGFFAVGFLWVCWCEWICLVR